MTTTRRKKIVEKLIGIGTVYQEESPVAKVRYALVVSQDVLIANTIGKSSQEAGSISVYGWL